MVLSSAPPMTNPALTIGTSLDFRGEWNSSYILTNRSENKGSNPQPQHQLHYRIEDTPKSWYCCSVKKQVRTMFVPNLDTYRSKWQRQMRRHHVLCLWLPHKHAVKPSNHHPSSTIFFPHSDQGHWQHDRAKWKGKVNRCIILANLKWIWNFLMEQTSWQRGDQLIRRPRQIWHSTECK